MWLFRNYAWLTAIAVILGVALSLTMCKPDSVATSIFTVCGVGLGVLYYVQKQKIDDIQLFEKLFTAFNERYRQINDQLRAIVEVRLEGQEREDVLHKFFNLCGEEYMFYKEGRILPSAWKSWCRGMMHYFNHEFIRQRWLAEEGAQCNYGLTLAVIEKNAN